MRSVWVQLAAAGLAVLGGAWLIGLWAVGVVLVCAGLAAGADALLRDREDAGKPVWDNQVLERWRRTR